MRKYGKRRRRKSLFIIVLCQATCSSVKPALAPEYALHFGAAQLDALKWAPVVIGQMGHFGKLFFTVFGKRLKTVLSKKKRETKVP